jgi:hypothetical protein
MELYFNKIVTYINTFETYGEMLECLSLYAKNEFSSYLQGILQECASTIRDFLKNYFGYEQGSSIVSFVKFLVTPDSSFGKYNPFDLILVKFQFAREITLVNRVDSLATEDASDSQNLDSNSFAFSEDLTFSFSNENCFIFFDFIASDVLDEFFLLISKHLTLLASFL